MEETRMSLAEHLNELRWRLIMCIIAALVMMAVAFCFCEDIFYPILTAPLDSIQGNEAKNPFVLKTALLEAIVKHRRDKDRANPPNQLYYGSLTMPFMMQLKVSCVIGIILALPVIVYEIWAFIAAGLYAHERKYVKIYGPVSLLLFLAGVALAYFLMLPISVVFLIQQGDVAGWKPMLMVDDYFSLVAWLLLGFGLVFEMPLAALFLAKIGVVTPEALAKWRRAALLVIVIAAAVITPTGDPFTLMALTIPMAGLYEVSILVTRLATRKRARAA